MKRIGFLTLLFQRSNRMLRLLSLVEYRVAVCSYFSFLCLNWQLDDERWHFCITHSLIESVRFRVFCENQLVLLVFCFVIIDADARLRTLWFQLSVFLAQFTFRWTFYYSTLCCLPLDFVSARVTTGCAPTHSHFIYENSLIEFSLFLSEKMAIHR